MTFLLDTNAISETSRRRRNPGFERWWTEAVPSSLFLSSLTLGELVRGVHGLRIPDPIRRKRLEEWFAEFQDVFVDRILPVTDQVASEWGRMSVDRSRPIADTLLAATAKVHDLTLVTRNVRDVAGLDIRVLNPFS